MDLIGLPPTPESAVETLIIIGLFVWERIKEKWALTWLGVKTLDGLTFASGFAGLLYIVLGITVLALILIDGFGRHFKRDCFFIGVLVVLFIVSCLKAAG